MLCVLGGLLLSVGTVAIDRALGFRHHFAMLVLYVHHIGQSLRVSALIELVGNDTRRLLDERHPNRIVPERLELDVVAAPNSGVLIAIDRPRLVEPAGAADCVVHVVPAVGGFGTVWCTVPRSDHRRSSHRSTS